MLLKAYYRGMMKIILFFFFILCYDTTKVIFMENKGYQSKINDLIILSYIVEDFDRFNNGFINLIKNKNDREIVEQLEKISYLSR